MNIELYWNNRKSQSQYWLEKLDFSVNCSAFRATPRQTEKITMQIYKMYAPLPLNFPQGTYEICFSNSFLNFSVYLLISEKMRNNQTADYTIYSARNSLWSLKVRCEKFTGCYEVVSVCVTSCLLCAEFSWIAAPCAGIQQIWNPWVSAPDGLDCQ